MFQANLFFQIKSGFSNRQNNFRGKMKGKCKVFSPLAFWKAGAVAISSCPTFFRSPAEKSPAMRSRTVGNREIIAFLCVSTRRWDGGRKIDFIGCPGTEITSVFLWKRKRLTAPRRPHISFESTRYTLDKYWRCLYPRLNNRKTQYSLYKTHISLTNENF